MMIGNMGNVAALTDRLALMPDQMLPRLAQQYKGDAITLSLILGEKQRRDHVRNSVKTQAAAQQPKVNDQIVASMQPQQLPEDVGIGALPVPNMQQMADGGIAGYADGDLIAQNEPVVRMAGGGHIPRYQGNLQDGSVVRGSVLSGTGFDIPGYQQASTPQFIVPQQGAPENTPILRRWYEEAQETGRQYQIEQAKARIAAGVGTAADRAILAEAAQRAPTTAQDLAQFDAATNRYMAEREAAKASAATKTDTAGKEAKPEKTDYSLLNNLFGTPRAAGAGIGALKPQTPTNFASTYNKLYQATVAEDPAAKERKELGSEIVGGAEARLARLKEEQAARGDVYKGREERLTKREQELEKSGEKNTGLALLEAGLSIMSTPGHWAQAVGKGAQVGTARYAEGLDKLRAAKERLSDARDRMEDLKINRDDMNARELRQANNEIDAAKVDARKLGIEGIMAAAGVKEKRAGAMFDATVREALTREEIQGRKEVAGMEAASRERLAMLPSAQERIALLLGGGNLEKGLARFTDIQAGKFNPATAYTEYLSKRKEGETILSPQEFVTQIKSIQALMGGGPPKPVDTTKPDRS